MLSLKLTSLNKRCRTEEINLIFLDQHSGGKVLVSNQQQQQKRQFCFAWPAWNGKLWTVSVTNSMVSANVCAHSCRWRSLGLESSTATLLRRALSPTPARTSGRSVPTAWGGHSGMLFVSLTITLMVILRCECHAWDENCRPSIFFPIGTGNILIVCCCYAVVLRCQLSGIVLWKSGYGFNADVLALLSTRHRSEGEF